MTEPQNSTWTPQNVPVQLIRLQTSDGQPLFQMSNQPGHPTSQFRHVFRGTVQPQMAGAPIMLPLTTPQHSHGSRHAHHAHLAYQNVPAQSTSAPSPEDNRDRPFVVNFDTNDGDSSPETSPSGGSIPNQSPSAPNMAQDPLQSISQSGMLPSLRMLAKSMEGSLPFIFLVFAKIMYDHRLGILIFVGLWGTFFHANNCLRKLIAAQRETQNSTESIGNLVWIIAFLSANIFFMYYFFDDQKLHRSLYFCVPEVEHVDLWSLLWIVGTADFLIKYATMLLKSIVTALPKQLLLYKKKGKYYLMIEMTSQFYRSLVPVTPWVYFLLEDDHGGSRWFSVVLLALYCVCKAKHVLGKFRDLRSAFGKFQVDLSYGTSPNVSHLEAYDNVCPICQDKFSCPVLLACKHVFCEDCVAMWFDRERTCPMCRANIVDNPQWRDGTTSSGFQFC